MLCLGVNDDDLLCSGVLTVKSACACVAGGWRDFVFDALEVVGPRAPSVYLPPFPIFSRVDTAASDNPCADEFDAKLGRRLCVGMDLVKSASIEPAPIDLRGPLRGPLAAPVPDTGGY